MSACAAKRCLQIHGDMPLQGDMALEDHLERKLDHSRSSGCAERAEVGVHLSACRIELRRGKQIGELRVVPGIEYLAAELDPGGVGEKRKALGRRHVPVVDAGTAQNAHAGVAECAYRRNSERRGVEV